MRVGVHVPYLETLGGGEKYALVILSEAIDSGCEAQLLCPDKPSPGRWRRLNVHVDPSRFGWVPTTDDDAATAATQTLDLLITVHNDVPPLSNARRSIAVLQFPFRPLGWVRAGLQDLREPFEAIARRRSASRRFASYDRFICYSEFVKRNLAVRWGVDAGVVYPPVDLPVEAPRGPRRPHILAVGRFIRAGNNKRQDVLIRAFAQLWRSSGRPSDWHLHLAGGSSDEEGPAYLRRGPAYLRRLKALAADLPVTFHVDAPLATIEQLYAQSSMFWHAAGFGQSDTRHPERMEHFGITTAEAMARGCIVMTVPKGGQAEILQDGLNGFAWNTIDELVDCSRKVLAEPAAFDSIRERAIESARAYSTERFRRQIRRLLFERKLDDRPTRTHRR